MATTDERWAAVDAYTAERLMPADPALEAALAASAAAGLPDIQVTPQQGTLLHILARIRKARRILEIGTLGGYSTIWLARALPPAGRLITLEIDPRHADVARRNVANAGLAGVVEIRVGPALATLAKLAHDRVPPFDLIFIDADKENIPAYFTWALTLAAEGCVVVVDNVVRGGGLADADSTDARVKGVRDLHELLSRERRVRATTIQTVGSKGYDGFTLVVVGGATARRDHR